jgi:hypothetical protein
MSTTLTLAQALQLALHHLYKTIAAACASDVGRRRRFRAAARGQLRASILLDAPSAARAFESALRHIWIIRVNS